MASLPRPDFTSTAGGVNPLVDGILKKYLPPVDPEGEAGDHAGDQTNAETWNGILRLAVRPLKGL